MRKVLAILFVVTLAATQAFSADNEWYTGDERCLPPKNDGRYSAPYNALDHPRDYPTFNEADKPGWSCSYQREDGVIVQYGNSQTPQQQWLAIWGGGGDNNSQ
jgi:hypothetical protein